MTKFKKIVFVALLSFSALATAGNSCKDKALDEMQFDILKHSYAIGSESNFGFTLAAIAMQESNLGRYLINWNDPSFGIHHILLSTASSSMRVKGYYNRIELAQQVMNSPDFSAHLAISVLTFWKNYLADRNEFSWRNLWGAYNAGHNYDSKAAQEYASKISENIIWMDRCVLSDSLKRKLEHTGIHYELADFTNYKNKYSHLKIASSK